jgi:general secretion pathway protein E
MKATSPTAPKPAASPAATPHRLDWRELIEWLRGDGVISAEEAQRTQRRFTAADSAQHPLLRLGNAGLVHAASAKPLDVEALTEWLAKRLDLPYLRIDPLKVDVGRVAEVMSINYAEARRALPLNVGAAEITIATSEPLDLRWVAEIEAHTRKKIRLVVANPF